VDSYEPFLNELSRPTLIPRAAFRRKKC
jgi:hypothetical protein